MFVSPKQQWCFQQYWIAVLSTLGNSVLFIWPALQYSILKCYTALLFSFYEKLQSTIRKMFIEDRNI